MGIINVSFDEVLDAVEHLAPEEQAELITVIQRRLAEHGRQRIVSEVRQGIEDFQAGRAKPASVNDLMREIES